VNANSTVTLDTGGFEGRFVGEEVTGAERSRLMEHRQAMVTRVQHLRVIRRRSADSPPGVHPDRVAAVLPAHVGHASARLTGCQIKWLTSATLGYNGQPATLAAVTTDE
jgi:hypothetical protein